MLKPKLQKRFYPQVNSLVLSGNIGREIIAQATTERISIRETNIAVLQTLERNLRYLLASIAVTVVAPIIIPQFHLNEPIPAIISIIAGLVAFILGIYEVS